MTPEPSEHGDLNTNATGSRDPDLVMLLPRGVPVIGLNADDGTRFAAALLAFTTRGFPRLPGKSEHVAFHAALNGGIA